MAMAEKARKEKGNGSFNTGGSKDVAAQLMASYDDKDITGAYDALNAVSDEEES